MPWLPIAQNSPGCIVTPREKDLSPRFGNAGRDHRDHLAKLIKANYNTISLETWGWGERSYVGFYISSCLWKKQMLAAHANTGGTRR